MSRSRSSLLRSMPMYQAQLNRTAFRSFAPAAGVYNGAPPPRPPRPPWPPGARAAAAAPPCRRACANAPVDSALIVRATTIATLVQVMPFREFMVISRFRSVVRVTGRDFDLASVRHDHRLEKSQRTAVVRRDVPHRDLVPVMKSIRPGWTNSSLREPCGRAQCEHPIRGRSVLVLYRDGQRPVGIHKFYDFDRPRDF